MTRTFAITTCALVLALAGCGKEEIPQPEKETNPQQTPQASEDSNPQQAFFDRLSAHCDKAYAGKLVSKDEADADFIGKDMRIHFASCSDKEIRIPFHVEMQPGQWNRSRTWIVTRTNIGLRLKHDHRHEDGSDDIVTYYGGDTAPDAQGTKNRQEFPVDGESIALFEENDLPDSITNIWAIEVDDAKYAYELRRENRHFRVEFDLSEPVEKPPLPWGFDK